MRIDSLSEIPRDITHEFIMLVDSPIKGGFQQSQDSPMIFLIEDEIELAEYVGKFSREKKVISRFAALNATLRLDIS